MAEPMSEQRLQEIRNLRVHSTSSDAPHNPDVWELEAAREDLLAQVDWQRQVIDLLGKQLQGGALDVKDALRSASERVDAAEEEAARNRQVVEAISYIVGNGKLPSAWNQRWRDRAEAAEAENERLRQVMDRAFRELESGTSHEAEQTLREALFIPSVEVDHP